ncbi:hypothetical protein H0H93_016954 [Arthromyces matolae]|nr:hypothetical protein H0H93_016954 [Arthromyces matolae]
MRFSTTLLSTALLFFAALAEAAPTLPNSSATGPEVPHDSPAVGRPEIKMNPVPSIEYGEVVPPPIVPAHTEKYSNLDQAPPKWEAEYRGHTIYTYDGPEETVVRLGNDRRIILNGPGARVQKTIGQEKMEKHWTSMINAIQRAKDASEPRDPEYIIGVPKIDREKRDAEAKQEGSHA